jgi:hypothetical protein
MRIVTFVYLVILLVSCTNTAEESNQKQPTASTESNSTAVATPPQQFRYLDEISLPLDGLNDGMEVAYQKLWHDADGENAILFLKKDRVVAVKQYVINAEEATVIFQMQDEVEPCAADLTLAFVKNAILVSDMDNNGYGEATFAYKKACLSDGSPETLRLFMVEKGQAYSITGKTGVALSDTDYQASEQTEVSFEGAPANFLAHANVIWKQIAQ